MHGNQPINIVVDVFTCWHRRDINLSYAFMNHNEFDFNNNYEVSLMFDKWRHSSFFLLQKLNIYKTECF